MSFFSDEIMEWAKDNLPDDYKEPEPEICPYCGYPLIYMAQTFYYLCSQCAGVFRGEDLA